MKHQRMSRLRFLKGTMSIILLISTLVFMQGCTKKENPVKPDTTPSVNNGTTTEKPVVNQNPTEDPAMENPIDLVSFDSINVIINKKHPLPDDFVPDNLVKPDVKCLKDGILLQEEAANAMEEMFAAAKDAGYTLAIGSAYRSYNYQKTLYDNYAKRDGEAAANRYSAKPGQSEHQTGLAADLATSSQECYLKGCFEDMAEGKWLKDNSYLYGYILRYTQEKEEITGYIFEPWHFRYIGKEEALKVYNSGLTLEEYYELMD